MRRGLLLAIATLAVGCYEPSIVEGGGCGEVGECPDGLACVLGICRSDGPANVAFVTSSVHTGNLGGVDGADQICRDRAAAAGLPGDFIAFVATADSAPADRIAGTRGWLRPDGLPIADTASDLLAGVIFYPPLLDESGTLLSDDAVIRTGATEGGAYDELGSCGAFASAGDDMAGSGLAEDIRRFLGGRPLACSAEAHLLCLGVGQVVPIEPAPVDGRTVFVSVGNFVPGVGLGYADAICNEEAARAGLAGDYLAVLATYFDNTGVSSSSRFTRDVPGPVVRPDGIVVSESSESFFGGVLDTGISVTAAGSHVQGVVWIGATAFDAQCAYCCGSYWGAVLGATRIGIVGSSSSRAYDGGDRQCYLNAQVYCLEEPPAE